MKNSFSGDDSNSNNEKTKELNIPNITIDIRGGNNDTGGDPRKSKGQYIPENEQ